MSNARIIICLLRRDLRLKDNPIFHSIAQQSSNSVCTHLLPLYVFPAHQVEVSGFLSSDSARSPYPEARSGVAGFWRCGTHRARFLAESVFDLKDSLESAGSGLVLRAGKLADVVKDLLAGYEKDESAGKIVGLWMTGEEAVEERREEREVRSVVEGYGKEFKLFRDEKYFIDE